MALESSDLNDGTIIKQTKQSEDARGNIQFNITLPSGRILKSEFMPRDKAREALKTWLDVVKEQAIADSNAERLERAAKARRGKMDVEHKPGDDQPLFRAGGARVEDEKPYIPDYVDHPDQERVKNALESMQKRAKKLDSPEDMDPLEFAKERQQMYDEQVRALKDAERKLRKWTIIVETLEAIN